jgi:CBS domain-containing protein
MEGRMNLGTVWGVPVGVHFSWLVVFGLVTWSLAAGYFPGEYAGWAPAAYWTVGAVTSLLFFGSILVHELGHSWVARRNGIPIRSITLFIFGGVAQIGREPTRPGVEFRIAIAGPLTSLGLAGLFAGIWLLTREAELLAASALWLARINGTVALFNLAATHAEVSLRELLRGATVAQAMTRECARIGRDWTLERLVQEEVLGAGRRCFLVAADGHLRGLLTLHEVKAVPRDRWPRVRTEDVMAPLEQLESVGPQEELLVALKRMDDANVAQMPVVAGDRLLGMIGREQILHYVRTRAELGI